MAFFEQRCQASALAQLRHDVGPLVESPVQNLHNVRMTQDGRLFGGFEQAFYESLVTGKGSIEHLECDPAILDHVKRQKNRGDSADADKLFDAITIVEDAVDHLGQRSGFHGALIVLASIGPRAALLVVL